MHGAMIKKTIKSALTSMPYSYHFSSNCLKINICSVKLLPGQNPHWYSPGISSGNSLSFLASTVKKSFVCYIQQHNSFVVQTLCFVTFLKMLGKQVPYSNLQAFVLIPNLYNQLTNSPLQCSPSAFKQFRPFVVFTRFSVSLHSGVCPFYLLIGWWFHLWLCCM